MSDLKYLCPKCRTSLLPVTKGDFDTWECADGHGVGLTLTEAYGHFQEDEIHAIWKAAKNGPKSSLQSPALGQPMVAVTVAVDDDEIKGNEGPGSRLVTLDVAPDEQFLWFHVGDFHSMPGDLPNPLPSAEELARVEVIRAQAKDFVAGQAESATSTVGYRVANRVAARLGLTALMNRLGKAARERLGD